MPEDQQPSSQRRESRSEELLDLLTPVMSALGVLFLLVVIGEYFAREGGALSATLTVVGWALWAMFVAEFAVRLLLAPDRARFLRRNWWQLVFLVLPFLRVLRLARSLRALRALRAGRVLSSAVRSSRSARSILGGRIAWLALASAITALASSQLLYEFGDYETYGDALYVAALATVGGEPFHPADPWGRVLEVGLLAFSVVVFASLAGTIGAYLLGGRGEGG